MIRVLHKRPGMGYPAEVKEIEPGLSAMQKLVAPVKHPDSSSYIEPVRVPELQALGIDLYANEEGLFNGCRPNLLLFDGQVQIMGPVFFVGGNNETGETVGLTDSQLEAAQEWLKAQPQVIGLSY